MTTYKNKQVLLVSRPKGIPTADNFQIVESALPVVAKGQVLVRNIYLSVEPAMKGWVSAIGNYAEPVALNSVMRSFATGMVIDSLHPSFAPGEFVTGLFGWQDYALVEVDAIDRKIAAHSLPISTSLGVLGLNGMTAYFGLLDIGQPLSGDTVVVSTAAGAVGSCVGQIAKLKNCHTIGITGSQEKVDLCKQLYQYDQAINYNDEQFKNELAHACPKGIDIYFDNTGGVISDAVLQLLNIGGRVVICGTSSIGNWEERPVGPRQERQILVTRARIQGFLIFDYKERYPEALAALTEWVSSGLIKYREEILCGIEEAPCSISSLYRGENLGKRLIQIYKIQA
tara:strand:- start:8313 stop:9335 length:1023 start_codon:yes stop_codon:yes gene_type:complete